ncbi:MAG: PAS domain S-box protein, partial [Tolypothrix sp. T3-bin4]|nr:PAS domain S-box protein [Tolypothrix sp. T3-bin4]
TDYQLIWNDGLSVLKTFKQRYPHCPVVMFTSRGTQEVAVEPMKSGLDDYVLKSPKHYSRLATAVRLAVERAKARHKAAHLEIRLNSLLNRLEVGVFRATLDGRLLEANHAFLQLLGGNTLKKAQGFRLSEIFPRSHDRLYYQKEQSQPEQLQTWEGQLYPPDGTTLSVKWSETLTNTDGELVIDGLVEDIAERKRSENTLQLLAQAGSILSSSLDYETTLANVANLTVPALADWCALDVVEEDGSNRRVAVVHQDPQKVELARELQRRYPIDPNAPYGVANVL